MNKTSYFVKHSYFGAIGRLSGEDHFCSPAQYSSEDCRTMSQRLRRLKEWALGHLGGTALEKTLDLRAKGRFWRI
jgi:hypothetical protein